MGLSFRLAKEEDTELVISLQNEAFFDDFKRFGICPSYDRNFDQMKWIINHSVSNRMDYDCEEEKNKICYYDYIIYEDTLPVGNMIIKRRENGEYHLASLCVVTSHRAKGIGSKALEFIESNFDNCSLITLDTPADKEENIYFYWKNGYEVAGQVISHEIPCVLFEKKISRQSIHS